mmetsp:Transcript_24460/g.63148  ORF Transcript_24460/g.63148 Transcript_24460/m.63148 type:complete len:212 (+) Transcript_24460:189-824(+)
MEFDHRRMEHKLRARRQRHQQHRHKPELAHARCAQIEAGSWMLLVLRIQPFVHGQLGSRRQSERAEAAALLHCTGKCSEHRVRARRHATPQVHCVHLRVALEHERAERDLVSARITSEGDHICGAPLQHVHRVPGRQHDLLNRAVEVHGRSKHGQGIGLTQSGVMQAKLAHMWIELEQRRARAHACVVQASKHNHLRAIEVVRCYARTTRF